MIMGFSSSLRYANLNVFDMILVLMKKAIRKLTVTTITHVNAIIAAQRPYGPFLLSVVFLVGTKSGLVQL